MIGRHPGPPSPEGVTLGDALHFETSGTWPPGLVRYRFWWTDPRVPELYRGDGPFDPRQILGMSAEDVAAWETERDAWLRARLDWLREAAG